MFFPLWSARVWRKVFFSVPMQPISERSNDLTRNLDVVGSRGVVRLLRQCDTQIFAGWEEWTGLSDLPILEKLEALADSILPEIRALSTADHPCNVKFVMSGAGTSGRLAFYIARNLNKVQKGLTLGSRTVYFATRPPLF